MFANQFQGRNTKIMNTRKKLETAIEKQMYDLVRSVREYSRDFTILYIRKNKIEVDRDSLSKVLDVVDMAVADGFQKNIDKVMRKLDSDITELTEPDPLVSTPKKKK